MALHIPRPSSAFGFTSLNRPKSCVYESPIGNPSTKNGSVNDIGYRKIPTNGVVQQGFLLPTPWFMVADLIIDEGCDYVFKVSGFTSRKYGDEYPFVRCGGRGNSPYNTTSQSVSLPVGLSNSSASQALNKIKNSHVDLGVAFAEANQTLRSLGMAIASLYTLYRDARKGRWDRLAKRFSPRGAANSWLSYQYGWLPLMNDIYGLQQQLKEPFRKEGFLIKAQHTSTQEWSPNDALSPGVSGTTYKRSGTGFYKSRTVYYAKIADSELYALSQLGLVNPLLVAWELVPLSFVVDWILPIGNFLENLTAAVGTSFVAAFEDRIAYGRFIVEGHYGTYVSGRKGRLRRDVYAFERRPIATFVPPGLYLGNGLTTRRAISALALFTQRL